MPQAGRRTWRERGRLGADADGWDQAWGFRVPPPLQRPFSSLQGGEGRAAARLPGGGAGLGGRNPKAPPGGALRCSPPLPHSPALSPHPLCPAACRQPGSSPSLIPLARGWPSPAPHRLAQAQALSGQAKRAELYREEVEALRERAGRLPRLQEELRRCRERLQAAEACKSQLEGRREAGPAGGGRGANWGLAWRREGLVLGTEQSPPGEMGEVVSGAKPSGGWDRGKGEVGTVGRGRSWRG